MKKQLLLLLMSLMAFSSYAGQKSLDEIQKQLQMNKEIPVYIDADFEANIFPPTGWTFEYEGINRWSRVTSCSAYGNGIASAKFDFYHASNTTIQSLITNIFTPSIAGDTLKFDEAYATYLNENDQLEISTSNDAGTTWNTLILLNGGISGELVTAPPINHEFIPEASQWSTKMFLLPIGTNKIKFRAISQRGNDLYLDNIRVGNPPSNDAGTISINVDSLIFSGRTNPTVTFKNFGTGVLINVPVTLMIDPGEYSSTKIIPSLDPGASTDVIFNNWTANNTVYTFKAYTSSAGDQDNTNDTLVKSVTAVKGIDNYEGWSTLPNLPAPRWGAPSVFVRKGSAPNDTGFVYVISGATVSLHLSTNVFRLNLRTNTWENMAPIPTGVYQVGAAAVGGKIYIPGGFFDTQNSSDSLFIYDILNNTWSRGAKMPYAVGDCAVGTYNNKIYVFDGANSYTRFNLVQVYDINTNTWSFSTPTPGVPLAGLTGAIAGNVIVLTGGYDLQNQTNVATAVKGIINNDGTITWSGIPDYPGGIVSRHSAGIPFVSSQSDPRYIFFTGGDPTGTGSNTYSSTWAWDTHSDSWLFAGLKPTGTSNNCNFVGAERNDSLFMISVGGLDGNSVSDKVECLALGLESRLLPVESTPYSGETNYVLKQNYPNPFNPSTKINFSLAVDSRVSFKVFNILGEEVYSRIENLSAGNHYFDFNGSSLSSGIYFYKLDANGNNGRNFSSVKKMSLVK